MDGRQCVEEVKPKAGCLTVYKSIGLEKSCCMKGCRVEGGMV